MYRYKIMGIIMGLSLMCKLSPNDNGSFSIDGKLF